MNESSGLFAAAEIGNAVSREAYDEQIDALRVRLLNMQYDLQEREFSVVLLIAGDDRPGAVNMLRTLHEWMDARYLLNHITFGSDTSEDAERPVLGRYWRRLPPDGRIGLFLGGWPTSILRIALDEGWSAMQLDSASDHMNRFEKQLADDGALVQKFWLHLPQTVLQQRLEAAAQDPQTHWDFAQHDWELFDRTADAFALIERLVRRTNTPDSPWQIIESTDPRYCTLTVGHSIADALEKRLAQAPPEPVQTSAVAKLNGQSLLDQIDLSMSVKNGDYEAELASLQARINQLAYRAFDAGLACVLVFEGVDAAGKGGTIRRLVRAMPVQHMRVIRIAAPNEAERARHYLWRFWTRVPQPGKTVIFDRSWYGRVLVERVEGFASEQEWSRAYEEINEFEETLCDAGILLCKFWLQIDADEQLQRFHARAQTPYKKYKLTADDFRNRENWDHYQVAAHDMVARTSTRYAPWNLIAANDKRHARLQVLRVIAEQLQARLDGGEDQAEQGNSKKTKKRKKS